MQIDVVTKDNTWVGLILGSTKMNDFPLSDMIAFSANGADGSLCEDLRTDPIPAYGNV